MAATELRFTDRQSVVNLALSSESVYNIVAPILYHTIIITNKTRDLIAAFTRDESTREAAKRVCSHVHMLLDDDSEETSINPDLLLNVVSVSAGVKLASAIAEAQCQALQLFPPKVAPGPSRGSLDPSRFVARIATAFLHILSWFNLR